MSTKTDIESGGGGMPLYPSMVENPELRWSFIRKVYSIVTFQLILTIGVASVDVFVRPITHFFFSSTQGFLLFILLLLLPPLITLCPLFYYRKRHPLNYFFLVIFTVTFAFPTGLICALTSGKIILISAILTTVVVVTLTLYTFLAANRGHDFKFLGPFLLAALLVILVFALIQVFFPLGKLSQTIYGCVASIVFCGFIIYDTEKLIKRFSYDEHIWASVSLYAGIIYLFVSLLTAFRAAD